LDLTAAINEPFCLVPGDRGGIPTGIIVEIPPGYEGQVRARSGLAAKAGIALTNGVGTIDSDYRGEIIVLVVNLGKETYTFQPGERIAQLLISPVLQVLIEEVEAVDAGGDRGTGGFGSTGRIHIGNQAAGKTV
jgi:dUTP pyrophosphatase